MRQPQLKYRWPGRIFAELKWYAQRLQKRLAKIDYLRDVQIAQPLRFPQVNISIDRYKLAQMGLTIADVARSITDATSSSRFTEKNLWLDVNAAYTYQVQVQVPEYLMNSFEQLQSVPLVKGKERPVLSDVAELSLDTVPGEYDRTGREDF